MMFLQLIVCTSLVYGCVALSDYCKIEECDCTQKHIGCINNTEYFEQYKQGVENIRPIELTERIRNDIYYKINLIKNQIASGKLNESGFPSAACMKMIRWHDEFEYLSKLYAQIIFFDIDLCTFTDTSVATYYLVYQDVGRYENLTTFIDDGLESFFDQIKQKNLEWMSSYFSETEQFGCGISEFTKPISQESGQDGPATEKFLSLRCIFDTVPDYRATYQIGEPCSLCNNTVCDEVFTSLCKV